MITFHQSFTKGFYALFHLQFITLCHNTTVTSISINCHLSVNLVLAFPLHFIALYGQPASSSHLYSTQFNSPQLCSFTTSLCIGVDEVIGWS